VSDYPANAKQAAPPVQLEVHIAEWWAMGEIQRLRTELAEARRDAEHWREARRSAIEAGDALMTELAEARRDAEAARADYRCALQYIERLRNERDAAVAHAGDAARGET
jgi:chromosome segregation ATPase